MSNRLFSVGTGFANVIITDIRALHPAPGRWRGCWEYTLSNTGHVQRLFQANTPRRQVLALPATRLQLPEHTSHDPHDSDGDGDDEDSGCEGCAHIYVRLEPGFYMPDVPDHGRYMSHGDRTRVLNINNIQLGPSWRGMGFAQGLLDALKGADCIDAVYVQNICNERFKAMLLRQGFIDPGGCESDSLVFICR